MSTTQAPPTTITDRLNRISDTLDRLAPDDSVHIGVNVSRYPGGRGGRLELNLHCDTVEEMRRLRRAVGPCTKDDSGAGLILRGEVDGVKVIIWPPADTCRRVQVGTETVEREVPTGTETVTETVPVYEWDCGDVLRDEREAVPA